VSIALGEAILPLYRTTLSLRHFWSPVKEAIGGGRMRINSL
jgi:hypothetical protein